MTTKSRLHWLLLLALCLYPPAWADIPADAVWIDVRSPSEYAQDHLPPARSVPLDDIEAGVEQLQIGKDTPIYLYCGSGRRAGLAKTWLEGQGYSNVTNAGGLEDARKLLGDAPP